VKPIYLTVEITTATTGQVAFKVYDDTGSVVSGAEVNLISKAFYVNVTPQGRQEYNNVIKGITNSEGYLLFIDVQRENIDISLMLSAMILMRMWLL